MALGHLARSSYKLKENLALSLLRRPKSLYPAFSSRSSDLPINLIQFKYLVIWLAEGRIDEKLK